MASWFQRNIGTKRWATAWNSVTDLYALQITSSAFDGSAVTQSPSDPNNDSIFHLKADEYKKVQENWKEE
jgi:hypothetical protein